MDGERETEREMERGERQRDKIATDRYTDTDRKKETET